MLTLHAIRLELGKSYRVTCDLLSEMPGVLDEIVRVQPKHLRDLAGSSWREYIRNRARITDSFDHEIAIKLVSDFGLCAAAALDIDPRHISRMTVGCHSELEVAVGEDTAGK